MTDDQVIYTVQDYAHRLAALGYPPIQTPNSAVTTTGEARIRLGHAHWMCLQIPEFVQNRLIEKSMRWLGFIQAILWCEGVFTIDEMRGHNTSEREPKSAAELPHG